MDYIGFFNFFCSSCFCKFERMIKVYLSVCGIHSNVGTSKDRVITFFETISPASLNNPDVSMFLEKYNDEDVISISSITYFLLSNVELYNTFWMVKKTLLSKFFTTKNYEKIIRRMSYFDMVTMKNGDRIKEPKEKKLSKLYRICIKKEPPPYYSDYRILGSSVEEIHKYLIYTSRLRYGYSRRITASTISITTSDDTSHESHQENLSNSKSKQIPKTPIQSPNLLKFTLQKRSTRSNQIMPLDNNYK